MAFQTFSGSFWSNYNQIWKFFFLFFSWKKMFKTKISNRKFCPQWLSKHSVDHCQAIAIKFEKKIGKKKWKKNLSNLIAIAWKWSTECLESHIVDRIFCWKKNVLIFFFVLFWVWSIFFVYHGGFPLWFPVVASCCSAPGFGVEVREPSTTCYANARVSVT